MADRLLFMDRGAIVQTGTPEEVYRAPRDELVARSLGFKNIVPGVVLDHGELVEIRCPLGVVVADWGQEEEVGEGSDVLLRIDDSGIVVCEPSYDGPPRSNVVSGTVVERVFRGGAYEVQVRVGEGALFCPVPSGRCDVGLQPGDEVSLVIEPAAIKLLKGS